MSVKLSPSVYGLFLLRVRDTSLKRDVIVEDLFYHNEADKNVPKDPINNIPVFVQIMAWHRSGDESLSTPMVVDLLTHICVIRPQWVKCTYNFAPFFVAEGNAVNAATQWMAWLAGHMLGLSMFINTWESQLFDPVADVLLITFEMICGSMWKSISSKGRQSDVAYVILSWRPNKW